MTAKSLTDQQTLLGPLQKGIIFDVGANVGTISKRYRELFPRATIHCFEPTSEAFGELGENLKGYSNIVLNNLAVASSAGKRTLYLNNWHATNSLFPRSTGRRYWTERGEPKGKETVAVTTLDSYAEERGLDYIDILKMDTQGGELEVLGGAETLLANQSFGLVYTELMLAPHYEDAAIYYEVCGKLESYGYTLYRLYNLYYGNTGQVRQGDAIFVSHQIRAMLDVAPPEHY